MASEAQRLINISLGKIASSRNQRGGLRLHKSLMVANIIVQARTQAMMESVRSPPRSQTSLTNAVDSDRSILEEDQALSAAPLSMEAFRPSTSKLDLDDSDCESSFDSDDEMSVDFELDFGKIEETTPTNSSRKRKRSEDDDDDETSKPSKKFYSDTDICSVNNRSGLAVTVTVNDCANSLLDSLQMCHLTQDLGSSLISQSLYETQDFNKLNHGNGGFDLVVASSEFIKAQPVYETQTYNRLPTAVESFDMGFDDTDYNKDISLFQTDVISCSTQIREALDTLTRPVISLTV